MVHVADHDRVDPIRCSLAVSPNLNDLVAGPVLSNKPNECLNIVLTSTKTVALYNMTRAYFCIRINFDAP